jgi:hypothetical protein
LRQPDGSVKRYRDLPEFFAEGEAGYAGSVETRVHFHIPLDADPLPPLRSTRRHAEELLAYQKSHPSFCRHYEIETYTWGVLPGALQRPLHEHLVAEYRWVLGQLS